MSELSLVVWEEWKEEEEEQEKVVSFPCIFFRHNIVSNTRERIKGQ